MQSTIAVVEDHDAVRAALCRWLGDTFTASTILEAKTGEEGVALAYSRRPDLILMDVGLPQMSGIEAVHQIKAIAPSVRVVMLTIYEDQRYQEASADAGADAYVFKRRMYTDLIPLLSSLLPQEAVASPEAASPAELKVTGQGSARAATNPRGRWEYTIVLVADDDPEDCILLKDALEEVEADVDIRFFSDGAELMNYLHLCDGSLDCHAGPRPDLILLDLNMPRKDGFEVLEEIKAEPQLRYIPVVVLTTSKSAEDRHRSYELGASSFITKQTSYTDLVAAMKTLTKYWFDVVDLPNIYDGVGSG